MQKSEAKSCKNGNRKSSVRAFFCGEKSALFYRFRTIDHKRLTFAFTPKSGYTLGFSDKIAHSGLQGQTGGVFAHGCLLREEWETDLKDEEAQACGDASPQACIIAILFGLVRSNSCISLLSKLCFKPYIKQPKEINCYSDLPESHIRVWQTFICQYLDKRG